MPLILLDQDGPLADFDTAINDILEHLGLDPSELERTEWETTADIRRCFGDEAAEAVDVARFAPGFYRTLGVVPHAQRAVRGLLASGCEVVVCTAPSLRNPTCASDKLAWLDQHFPELRGSFAVVKDKTLVRGHVLLDDKPVVRGALEPIWRHVRFRTPGNAHITHGDVLFDWSDWGFLLEAAHAHPGLD